MKRTTILPVLVILVLTTLACSVTFNGPDVRVTAGPEQTLSINEAAPQSADTPELILSMGAGELNLSSGGQGLVSGTIRYNVDRLKPEVERDNSRVRIRQETEDFPSAIGRDLVNEWALKLGSLPMELTINAGAYEGTMDLSGAALRRLEVNDGASKSHVIFRQPNPEVMETLEYKTGASSVEMEGLANANFKEMTFNSGAGSYTLDFSGNLKQDAKVNITSAASSVKIIVPKGMRARVELTGGLSNVDQRGTWTVNDKVYETDGSGPLLSIEIEMGVGNVELTSR